jgi:hypothetical protein
MSPLNGNGLSARRLDLVGYVLHGVVLEAGHHHFGAVQRKFLADGLANAGAAAGHNGYFVFKSLFHVWVV